MIYKLAIVLGTISLLVCPIYSNGFGANGFRGGFGSPSGLGSNSFGASGLGGGLGSTGFGASGFRGGLGSNSFGVSGLGGGLGSHSFGANGLGGGLGSNSFGANGLGGGLGSNSFGTSGLGGGLGSNGFGASGLGGGFGSNSFGAGGLGGGLGSNSFGASGLGGGFASNGIGGSGLGGGLGRNSFKASGLGGGLGSHSGLASSSFGGANGFSGGLGSPFKSGGTSGFRDGIGGNAFDTVGNSGGSKNFGSVPKPKSNFLGLGSLSGSGSNIGGASGSKNDFAHDMKTKAELNNLFNKEVTKTTVYTRPLDIWKPAANVLNKFGINHRGLMVDTSDGQKWLVHKGNNFGKSSQTVVVDPKHMSNKWSAGETQNVEGKGLRIGDYVKAGGKDYSVLKGNHCISAVDKMKGLGGSGQMCTAPAG